jgi:polar amino acid transport system substrate-binding protein
MRRRSTAALALVLAFALIAGACGGTADTSDYNLVTADTLTVCTDSPYEPFEFQNDDDTFTGFDMELIREVADGLGLELSVTIQPFDGIWLAPQANTCDLVVSAMTITAERQANALFSDPYFDADQSLLVRAEEASTYATLADLAGKVIAVQTGTTGEIYATENTPAGATLKSYDEPAAMFLDLESGGADAILQDLPVNGFRSTKDDKFVVTDTFPTGEQYGFATSNDRTALMDAINEELQKLRDNGKYDEIFADWFGG